MKIIRSLGAGVLYTNQETRDLVAVQGFGGHVVVIHYSTPRLAGLLRTGSAEK